MYHILHIILSASLLLFSIRELRKNAKEKGRSIVIQVESLW
jgi:hypothetical protein